jgi:hypothetical protein
VPLVQVLSEGDISNPHRPGLEGRPYRRLDSDDPADRYRFYEIAGLAHVDTRYPPANDPASWMDSSFFAVSWPDSVRMNTVPHHRLFSMTLDHLTNWAATNTTPPRAKRIKVGADGLFAKDEYGNSRGGVRCVQLDVPKATYFPNSGVEDDGLPLQGVVGTEEPLPRKTLEKLYADSVGSPFPSRRSWRRARAQRAHAASEITRVSRRVASSRESPSDTYGYPTTVGQGTSACSASARISSASSGRSQRSAKSSSRR